MVENRTINDEIITMIHSEMMKTANPVRCKIINVYNNGYADVKTSEYGTLEYLKVYGAYSINQEGILIFLNNNLNESVVITSVDTLIASIINLTERVSKLEKKVGG